MNFIKDKLKWLGEIRDGFIVCLGLLYFLGFLSWGLFAWEYQLGVIPPLQSHYLLAATPLAGAILFVWLLGKWSGLLVLKKWPQWFQKQKPYIRLVVITFVIIGVIAGIVFLVILPNYNFGFDERPSWLTFFFFIVCLYGFTALLTVFVPEEAENSALPILIYPSLFFIFLMFYLFAVLNWFPKISQHFGGARPKCALIDLYRDRFSQESLNALALDPSSSDALIRSRKLGLVFYTREDVLALATQADGTQKRFELKRSDIASIEWCSFEEQQPAHP